MQYQYKEALKHATPYNVGGMQVKNVSTTRFAVKKSTYFKPASKRHKCIQILLQLTCRFLK